MKFDEAMKKCKPGQLVKHAWSSWNEHSTQYGKTESGKAYWTAGWTTGGDLTDDRRPRDALLSDDYLIYGSDRTVSE